MVRFDLLPFITFNDYQDLSNEEFLDRIHEPIDSEEIAVSSKRTPSVTPTWPREWHNTLQSQVLAARTCARAQVLLHGKK